MQPKIVKIQSFVKTLFLQHLPSENVTFLKTHVETRVLTRKTQAKRRNNDPAHARF